MGRASGYIGFCSYRLCLTHAINSDASEWVLCIREDGLKKVYINLYIFCKGHRITAAGLFGIVSKDSSSTGGNLQYIVSSLRHSLDWLGEYPCYLSLISRFSVNKMFTKCRYT